MIRRDVSSRCVYHPIKRGEGDCVNDRWEGTDFTVCPSCKQVVRREGLFNGTHICWSRSDFIKIGSTLPDM